MQYEFAPLALGEAKEADLAKIKDEYKFTDIASRAREITLDTFATDESASVQVRAFHVFCSVQGMIGACKTDSSLLS